MSHLHDPRLHESDHDQHSHDQHSHDQHSHDQHSHDQHSHDQHSHDQHSHDQHSHDQHSHDRPGDHAHDGHAHPAGRVNRVRHLLSELVGGHSHDATDQIDDALEANQAGRRALVISLVGLGATALLQAVVVMMSGSVALLGDTFHNLADALTAVPLLIAFALGRRPASKRYTYGYGRAEDLAGLFVIAMITLSAGFAAFEAVRRLLDPHGVTHLWVLAAAAVVGFLGNELVARYRIRVGRQIGSAALVADGLHARTDGFTSLAVLLGAGGAALGWWWADPVVGLLITIAILGVLRSAVAQVGARLMDAVDPATVDQASAAIHSVEGVEAVSDLKIRWIGHTLHAEADVIVDRRLSLVEGHDLAHHVEQHLIAYVGRLTSATIHVSPAG